MSNTGSKIFGSGANSATTGNVAWTNPGNVTANDASFATSAGSWALGQNTSQLLQATSAGISTTDIPSGSTINGVIIGVSRKNSATGNTSVPKDASLKLMIGGIAVGNDKADTVTVWDTTETLVTYGSSTDLWGNTILDSDVRVSGFGAQLQATIGNSSTFKNGTAAVNYMYADVYFTAPSGSSAVYRMFLSM